LLASIKQITDINFNLQEIDLMNMLGEPEHISSNEMAFWCPKCNPPHHKPKLFVNRHTFKSHCFVCGFKAYDLESLAYKLKKSLKYEKGCTTNIVDELHKVLLNQKENQGNKSIRLPNGLLPICNEATFIGKQYLIKRGLSEEDMWKWRLMYGVESDFKFNMRGRIVFPSFDENGELNYLVGRATWQPKDKDAFFMSYRQPPNLKKYDIIFNELDIDWNRPVVLVEGVFDAIGLPNSIPLLGKSLEPHWKLFQKLIENKCDIILMLDGDAYDEQFRIAANLKAYGAKNVSCIWLPLHMDPGSLKRSELLAYLHQAEPFYQSAELSFKERLITHGTTRSKKEITK
jgi:hypothetical protein